jgi:tetratricopeptide (TPR) repeat protein
MSASNPTSGGKRLDSWKEIAAFFGRDERTVSRWEKDQGLPVHRLPGTKGRVYAYTDELTAWAAAPKNAVATLAEDSSAVQSGTGAPDITQGSIHGSIQGLTLVSGGSSPVDSAPVETPLPEPAEATRTGHKMQRGTTIRLVAAAALGLAAVALVLIPPRANRAPKTTAHEVAPPRQAASGSDVLASTPSHDPEAEQLYLKGRYYWNRRTPDDLNKALDYFMQAVVHDPNYAQAYVGLADCYNLMREYTLMPSSEAYPRALAAAKKAVELDEQSSEAHASLAFVSFFGMWDVATGEREFRRAIDLNPNNGTAHHWYANALLAQRRLPESLIEIDRAQALDPASTSILADKGNILFIAGRKDEAVSLLKQMENREPAFRSPHGYLKGGYLRMQDYPDYLVEWRKEAQLMRDDNAIAIVTEAEKGFAAGGARGLFEATLQVQKKLYAQHSLPPMELARTYALLGNKDEALRYLKLAYDERDGDLLFVQIYSQFNSLHDEPAYRDLLARMNLPVASST